MFRFNKRYYAFITDSKTERCWVQYVDAMLLLNKNPLYLTFDDKVYKIDAINMMGDNTAYDVNIVVSLFSNLETFHRKFRGDSNV